jgi:murein L,D-transpeptidase YafK
MAEDHGMPAGGAKRRTAGLLALAALLPCAWQGGLQAGDFPVADKVIVEKGARKLHLLSRGVAFRTFDIALGMVPIGDKEYEGDFKTPEGHYVLDSRNPDSEYFLSIHVSYPDNRDRAEARRKGLDPGGAIMIHGMPNDPTRSETYYRTQDWTNGCIAVSNSDMIDIWLMTAENTPIEIRP